ncbi:multiple sugar transport system permease protein [Paenibacillus endophyticus]|uniref:Multiple sugar transport system permease protein n=2 Tax=Paenibacillus endophyticus TaxID=1294268 RepID=A0A7W5CAX5_9BACL|nr:sugar ABC transporter permease [Paenibacillus endophyticus]MBB3154368.1 multiple sugar transport system permease protein [Paenibacillus endophyticus]
MDMKTAVNNGPSPSIDQTDTKRHFMRTKTVDSLWGYFFIFPQLVGLVIFSLIPLILAFAISLMSWDGFGERTFVGLDNFLGQFKDPDFRTALVNTLYYTVLTVPTGIILAMLVAIGLNKVKGKILYRLIYFMPNITMSVAVAVVFMWLFNADFGLINLYLKDWFGIEGPRWLTDTRFVMPSIALLSIWMGLGGSMVLFLAGLQGISATYYEAAQIDGASKWQQLRHITVPLLSSTTFFVTIMSVIGSFQVFDQSFVMTSGGPAKASYTLVYHIYDSAFVDFTFGTSTSAAVTLFAMILTLTLLQMKISKRWVHYEE